MALQKLNIAHSKCCKMRCTTLTSDTLGNTQGKRTAMASTKSLVLTAFAIQLKQQHRNFLSSFSQLLLVCQRQAQRSELLSAAQRQKSVTLRRQHLIGKACPYACVCLASTCMCAHTSLHMAMHMFVCVFHLCLYTCQYTCPCTCPHTYLNVYAYVRKPAHEVIFAFGFLGFSVRLERETRRQGRFLLLAWSTSKGCCTHISRLVRTCVCLCVGKLCRPCYIGHKYIGHNCIGHNYTGHNYIGHNYIGHNYIGHN